MMAAAQASARVREKPAGADAPAGEATDDGLGAAAAHQAEEEHKSILEEGAPTGNRPFREIAKEMYDKAAAKAAGAAAPKAPAAEGDGEAPPADEDAKQIEQGRHPFEHPELGKIYVTVEQLRKFAAGGLKTRDSVPAPRALTEGEKEIATIEAQIEAIEKDDTLMPIEKRLETLALENKIARAERKADKEKAAIAEREAQRAAKAQTIKTEIGANLTKHKDVFDPKTGFKDLPEKVRTKLVATARKQVLLELRNPENDDKTEAQVIANVAQEFRAITRDLGLGKTEIIREYLGSKHEVRSAAPAPATKGGQVSQTGLAPKTGEYRNGGGRSALLRVFGG